MSSEYLQGLSAGPSLPSFPFHAMAPKVTPEEVRVQAQGLTQLAGISLAPPLPSFSTLTSADFLL